VLSFREPLQARGYRHAVAAVATHEKRWPKDVAKPSGAGDAGRRVSPTRPTALMGRVG
jgi:hypothetical protein